MKAKLFLTLLSLILLLFSLTSYGQGHETFDNLSTDGNLEQYINGSFVGENGIIWTYKEARRDISITGKAITLRNNTGSSSSLESEPISGGIKTLEFSYMQAFSNNVKLGVYINDELVETVTTNNEKDVIKSSGTITIDEPGNFTIKFQRESAGNQVTIDDIIWTAYSDTEIEITDVNNDNPYFEVDCNSDGSGEVEYKTDGNFHTGNEFIIELSNKDGSFLYPTIIGSIQKDGANPSGTIPVSIPENTANGNGYLIRLRSSSPSIVNDDYTNNIQINNTDPCLAPETNVPAKGLVVNEFSNGESGNKEYIELVVVGECGEDVDIRGFIVDDNDGSFGSEAIGNGYLQFTDNSQWENVPVGAIILLYNQDDVNPTVPADDLNDADNDYVYVIPHNESSLVKLFDNGESNYNGTNPTTSWNPIALGNQNDAVQTRMPDGTYYFGVSYGNSMNGGPDDMLLLNSNMTSKNGSFGIGDIRDLNNWTPGNAPDDETPGLPNNQENESWLALLRGEVEGCNVSLPISLLHFSGKHEKNAIHLSWRTASERNNDYYEILHSNDGIQFSPIGKIKAAGTTNQMNDYAFTDYHFDAAINYYRLKSYDFDGTEHNNHTISVQVDAKNIYYQKSTQTLFFPTVDSYTVYSPAGQRLNQFSKVKNAYFPPTPGIYFIKNETTGKTTKLLIP